MVNANNIPEGIVAQKKEKLGMPTALDEGILKSQKG